MIPVQHPILFLTSDALNKSITTAKTVKGIIRNLLTANTYIEPAYLFAKIKNTLMLRLKAASAKTLYILLAGGFSCLLQTGFSQSIVGVNNLTGMANATIPIYNVSVGDLSAPVALSYSASGLKVEDFDNSCGQGWRLIADASITRMVRGFPDDVEYQSDASYSVIKGWIRSGNGAPSTIQSLSFANTVAHMNDGNNNCGNEITDATTIANNFSYTYDTEPDQFYVSAPGLNCSFVFDASSNHVIKIIPYRDYQITYTTDSYGRITAFTVTNENGIKYYFDKANLMEHYIETYNPGTTVEIDPSTLEVFKRDFMMYRNKTYLPGYPIGTPLKYYEKWTLSKMEDTRGNRINFNYQNYTISNPAVYNRYSYKEIEILKPDGSGGFTKKKLYGINTKRVDLQLLSISTFSLGLETGSFQTVVQFNWVTPSGQTGVIEDAKLFDITLPVEKKKFELQYTKKFLGSASTWNGYGRYYLKGVKAMGTSGLCNNVNTQFDFTYYEVNEANNTCYCTPVVNNQTIDTIVNAQDYWGYYNGNFTNPNLNPQIYVYPDDPSVELFKVYPISGYSGSTVTITETANRAVHATHAIDGSLKKITYPTAATTELEYENNQFFDYDVNSNVSGGGIRIKKITNNDGLGTVDVTEYSYNDPTNTSVTTGRAISVPKFAIAFQNTTSYGNITDRVKNSTYRTTYDLNNEPKEILYGKVTVKKTTTGTGIGKSVYEYNTTGTFGSADITDWQESKNFVARTNLSSPTPCTAIAPSFLYNNNTELQYPFTANPNYDFERGLPTKVTHYNEAGQVVANEEYTYARSHTNPTKIYGVKLDEIGNTMAAYSKYGINTVVDNFLVTKTSRLYNSNSSTPITDVESYEYTAPGSSLNYRLLKSVSKQNSGDPATTVSRFKYSKEYMATTGSSSDDMNNAIYNFNNTLNKNVLIETTQSRVETGQPEKFTGGSFSTFKKFTVGDLIAGGTTMDAYLPYRSYQFVNQAGVTGFTPTTISSNVFTWDNTNYLNTPTTIEQYNTRGIPQVITDNSRIPKTILSTTVVNGVKVAEFVNARAENIGFSNFDIAEYTGNFTLGGNAIQAGGRYNGYCLNFQPNTSICRFVDKSSTSKNVIISFWLKDAAAIGSIYLCTSKFGCTATCTANSIVSFTRSSQWKYYQVSVPWPSATINSYYFNLGTSAAVKIDDVLIYPDNANVTTYSYTTNDVGTNLLTAKTGVNGIGNAYEYDNAGRLWLVRDQFDNIIEMKKYKLANRHAQQIPSVGIGYPFYPVVNTPVTFYAAPPLAYETGDCDAPPITYNWDFGDGSTGVSYGSGNIGATNITHTYTTAAKYQVSVTASSPGMTNVSAQTPATNSTNPPPFEVVAAPPPCYPGTPLICASGITQLTSANQCITTTCSTTPALPNTCSDTYFKLIGITGGTIESVYSVEWEIADEGSSSWSTYWPEIPGTGGFITSRHFHITHTTSYQMRAKVKFCNVSGTVSYSNVILVKNGD